MLVVSPLRSFDHEGGRGEEEEEILESFPAAEAEDEFSGGDLFDCINFDDVFMDDDGDLLPDLEVEPDILAELPANGGHGEDSNMDYIWVSAGEIENAVLREVEDNNYKGTINSDDICLSKEEIRISKSDKAAMAKTSWKETDHGGRKSAMQYCSKDLQGKRKLKVDWTPELHRRFVQAVELLGVDKAVPSRILELMGIDCLTRHNVASHLQKYRKHLQAREAKAASWTKRGQLVYGGKGGDLNNYQLGGNTKRDHKNPNWLAPTMGFPPPNNIPLQTFRPSLHVWGHPSGNHLWPKHLLHPPYPSWAPPVPQPRPPPPPHASYWHTRHQLVPHAVTPGGTLLFPHQTLTTMRFPSSTPPNAMCRAAQGSNGVPNGQSGLYPLFDSHPSKECIDAAIGDVLSKPWLPLPLGLKPPSMESVLGELQHQGVPKIPTATCA